MAKRSRADAEETRAALQGAARDAFAVHGFSNARLSDIVDAAGVTKGALFHHFGSKEGLFRSVWEGLQREMDATARTEANAARSRTDPYAAFMAGVRTYLSWATRPDYQQIVLIDGPSVLGLAGWYESDNDLGRQNVRNALVYLARKGVIAEGRIEALTVLVHNALNGAGFALARKEPGLTQEAILDAFEAVLKALR